jgi:hypothetical protein
MSVGATIDGYHVELDTDRAPACFIRRTVRFVDYAGELAQVRESCALVGADPGERLPIAPATVARIAAWAAERGY